MEGGENVTDTNAQRRIVLLTVSILNAGAMCLQVFGKATLEDLEKPGIDEEPAPIRLRFASTDTADYF